MILFINGSLSLISAARVSPCECCGDREIWGLGYRMGIPMYDGLLMIGVLEFGLGLDIFSRSLLEKLGVDSAILLRKDKLKLFLDRNPTHELWSVYEYGDYIFYKGCEKFANKNEWENFLNNYLYKVVDNGDHHVIFKGAELQDIHGDSIGLLLVDRSIEYYMDRAFTIKKLSLFLGILLWFLVLYFGYKRYRKETRFYEDKLLENNRELEHMSLYDHLTQIANRRNLEKLIKGEIKGGKKGGFSLVLFDIDNFKHINDSCGHGMGDKVLKELAHLAEDTINKGMW
ncbi:MAG: diguanylate cyclase [Wolinella sp.]